MAEMDTLNRLFTLVLSLMMLGPAYIARRHIGTWINPASIYSIFWTAYSFVPLCFALSAPINPLAVAYILFTCILFTCGILPFPWNSALAFNRLRQGTRYYDTWFLRTAFNILSPIVILFFVVDAYLQGFTLSDYLSYFFETSNAYMARRYSGSVVANVFAQAATTLTYVVCPIGGMLAFYAQSRWRQIRYFILALTPSALVMLLQAAKGTLFLCLTLYYAGALLGRLWESQDRLFAKSDLIQVLKAAPLMAPMVLAAFVARGFYQKENLLDAAQPIGMYLQSYAFGHLYAFSDWFTWLTSSDSYRTYVSQDLGFGYFTFTPVFAALGESKDLPHGVYDEFFFIDGVLRTNIYTWFRGLITDFGLWGSLAAIFLFSLVMHGSFFSLLRSSRPHASAAMFVFTLGFFYTSFIISLLIWNSIYVAFLLLAGLFFANAKLSGPARDPVQHA